LIPILLFVGTIILVLGCDLFIKQWSFAHVADRPVVLQVGYNNGPNQIPYHDAMSVIPHVLALRLTLNTGAIFGIAKGAQWFFVFVSVIATAFVCFLFWRSAARAYLVQTCYALILAGALGNMYDRMVYNAVRDMFWLFPGVHLPFGLHWPGGADDVYPWLFNIADAALIIGVLALMLQVHLADRRQRKFAKTAD
jgi:signal peptidase II